MGFDLRQLRDHTEEFIYSYCFCVGCCSPKSAGLVIRRKDGQEKGERKHKLETAGMGGALPGELGPTWLSHCSQASHFNEVADLRGQLAPFITVLKEAPGAGAGGAVGCWLLYCKLAGRRVAVCASRGPAGGPALAFQV